MLAVLDKILLNIAFSCRNFCRVLAPIAWEIILVYGIWEMSCTFNYFPLCVCFAVSWYLLERPSKSTATYRCVVSFLKTVGSCLNSACLPHLNIRGIYNLKLLKSFFWYWKFYIICSKILCWKMNVKYDCKDSITNDRDRLQRALLCNENQLSYLVGSQALTFAGKFWNCVMRARWVWQSLNKGVKF